MTVLQIILSKLQIDTVTPLVTMSMEEIGVKIRNYCNFNQTDAIPEGLNYTYANMVVDLVKYQTPESSDAKVSEVSMGDTQYKFDLSAERKIEALIFDYEADLRKYRRLKK